MRLQMLKCFCVLLPSALLSTLCFATHFYDLANVLFSRMFAEENGMTTNKEAFFERLQCTIPPHTIELSNLNSPIVANSYILDADTFSHPPRMRMSCAYMRICATVFNFAQSSSHLFSAKDKK